MPWADLDCSVGAQIVRPGGTFEGRSLISDAVTGKIDVREEIDKRKQSD